MAIAGYSQLLVIDVYLAYLGQYYLGAQLRISCIMYYTYYIIFGIILYYVLFHPGAPDPLDPVITFLIAQIKREPPWIHGTIHGRTFGPSDGSFKPTRCARRRPTGRTGLRLRGSLEIFNLQV